MSAKLACPIPLIYFLIENFYTKKIKEQPTKHKYACLSFANSVVLFIIRWDIANEFNEIKLKKILTQKEIRNF